MNLQLGSRHQPPIPPNLILRSQQLVVRLQHRIFLRQFLNALQVERAISSHHLRILRPPNQRPIRTASVFDFDGVVWGFEFVCQEVREAGGKLQWYYLCKSEVDNSVMGMC